MTVKYFLFWSKKIFQKIADAAYQLGISLKSFDII